MWKEFVWRYIYLKYTFAIILMAKKSNNRNVITLRIDKDNEWLVKRMKKKAREEHRSLNSFIQLQLLKLFS